MFDSIIQIYLLQDRFDKMNDAEQKIGTFQLSKWPISDLFKNPNQDI